MGHSEANKYDIIFAGGGAAACITASRLASAAPHLKILILEAGPHTQESPDHVQPGRYFGNLILPKETFTFHASKPSRSLAGRSVTVPAGRCVGGASSINFVMYTRAAASDYDDWERVYKNPGWGSKNLIPLLKQARYCSPLAETYQHAGDPKVHGDSGPLKISFAENEINIATEFLNIAAEYDKDRKHTDDVNDFSTCNAYGVCLLWYIDKTTGKRSDIPHHYIYNQNHSSLTILDRRRVVRVVLENNRAVGVEHIDDVVGRAKGTQIPLVAYASRLVVVSGGAFGSPAILERSGIGSAQILKKNGIPQVVDLPGVGEHYLDHNAIFTPYIASDDADSLDPLFRANETTLAPFVIRWLEDGRGKGLMSHNALDAGIKIRPNEEDLKEIGPEFRKRWEQYFAAAPDKPVMWFGPFSAYAAPIPSPYPKIFSMGYYTEYPASVGRVHIQAGLDVYAPLDFEPGYLDDPADLGVLRWMYKKGREFARRMNVYRGEYSERHPEFPEGSQAAVKVTSPVDMKAPNIIYSAEDDQAIDTYHRKTVETTWHSIGTCAMKPRDEGGVVDPRLNVYGVQNLKVADVSIAPANVGANTYNTAIAIGEKAAILIAEDLGIKGL
ncbi:GMC oxidoreductase-domain-containing protein [Collybia nuda]|uniref:GMC oxidoreductase-domain-containing protein n=1 Tax=Collybia nuda TaxID=64659 RepID=A0A9P5YD53_9AGAR|nr:GMC oxidoreductase-domain-containing protein [Collybia nuda]